MAIRKEKGRTETGGTIERKGRESVGKEKSGREGRGKGERTSENGLNYEIMKEGNKDKGKTSLVKHKEGPS
jgi:hypothetical protein